MATRPSSLQQAIHQTKPFRSAAHEAVVGLLYTADLIKRRGSKVCADAGITGQQYNVLRILRGAGPDGLPTLDIAERMIEQTPGITRLIDRIAAQGWVRRDRSADDRRQVVCRITASGLKLLAGLDAPVAESDERQMTRLSAAERKQLIALLEKVRAADD